MDYFVVSSRNCLASTRYCALLYKGLFYVGQGFSSFLFFIRLREITSSLKKQSAILEEIREIFTDKKRRPKRDEPMEEAKDITEFYV